MSRLQVPNRSFFPFGNPFRMVSPKGTNISPKLLGKLNTLENKLSDKLTKLIPKSKDDIVSFSWMMLATHLLSEINNDINMFIADLELPVANWDEKWIDVYLDVTLKLLDLCNAFSSELSRLNQSKLMLQCAVHNVASGAANDRMRGQSSLAALREQLTSRNPRIENCFSIIDGLVESLDLPRVKNSEKGQVLMQAMYGVKVVTVFICGIFTSIFSGTTKKLLDLTVADSYKWAEAFRDLQQKMNVEMKNVYSSGKFTALKELVAVDACVNNFCSFIRDAGGEEEKVIQDSIPELERSTAKLSDGLHLLTKEVDVFFQVVLAARRSLLSSLRG